MFLLTVRAILRETVDTKEQLVLERIVVNCDTLQMKIVEYKCFGIKQLLKSG